MGEANKAYVGGGLVGLASVVDLRPLGDYVAQGVSHLAEHTVFGAFGDGMLTFVSTATVFVVTSAIGYAAVWWTRNVTPA